MPLSEVFPYIGIVSLALIAIIGAIIASDRSAGTHSSLSAYAAISVRQKVLITLCLVVFSIPFYLWLLLWLVPTYHLETWVVVILVISFVAQILLVLFPLTPSRGRSRSNLIHLAAGSTVAISMLLLLIGLLMTPLLKSNLIGWSLISLGAIYCLLCIAGYLLYRSSGKFFLFESIYIIVFMLCMAVATYVGVTQPI